jgi:hypothetical protein
MKLIAVTCFALVGCGKWTHRDTVAELAFATVAAGDWLQTRGVVSICAEENSIIGACGDNVPPDIYFPIGIALHAAVAAALPPKWRLAWQAIGVGAELNQVWRNYAAGYGFDGSVPELPAGFMYTKPK